MEKNGYLIDPFEDAKVKKDFVMFSATLVAMFGADILNKQFNTDSGSLYVLEGAFCITLFNFARDYIRARANQHYYGFSMDNTKEENTDYEDIRDMYKIVLENIKNFFNELKLKDPVEIYTTHRYAAAKGYLSNNKKLIITADGVKDLPGLLGAEIISGKGICRHMSPSLVDILNTMDIKSFKLWVGFNDKIGLSQEAKDLQFVHKQVDISNFLEMEDEEERKRFYADAKSNYYIGRIYDVVSKLLYLVGMPNHMIACTEYNDKSYILDPTNALIYKALTDTRYAPLTDPEYIVKNSYLFGRVFKYYKEEDINYIKRILSKDSISYEEYREMWCETLSKCEANNNMFEDFYNQNQDLYKEISAGLDKFKTRFKKLNSAI